MMEPSLSKRGQYAAKTKLRIDFDLYFEAVKNCYHPTNNPNGAFPLNTAENKLCWDILKQKIQEITRTQPLPEWVASYTSSRGHPSFRQTLADFYNQFISKDTSVEEDDICLSAGATSVIELTSWIIAEPDDVAVFPTPSYPVYKQDIGNKAAIERYDLITHHDLSPITQEPVLTLKMLEDTRQSLADAGKRFRMLVITNPDNPTGGLYTLDRLRTIAEWCIEQKIHLIVNEIYALSSILTVTSHLVADYEEHRPFESFARIISQKRSPWLHLWYALSKDFGVSGFRVGMVFSKNQDLMSACENLNAPSMVSNYTQWIMEQVLADTEFVQQYIQINQKKLTETYDLAAGFLKKNNIPYVPARGSLFVWADFSRLLKENTPESEVKLWKQIYQQTGVLLTPGAGFGHSKNGIFRIVHSCFSVADLSVAFGRLQSFLQKNP